MNPGATFERVYRALKEQVTSGRFRPGDHLEPAALSEELNSSVTPVRDALHRLVGERLVHAPRGDGFRVPLLTEAALRELYSWNGQLLSLAIRPPRSAAPGHAAPGDRAAVDPVARIEALVLKLAAWSGSSEHRTALGDLNDRLQPYRRAESTTLETVADELLLLEDAADARDLPLLRRLVGAYHRRRTRAAPEILAAVNRR